MPQLCSCHHVVKAEEQTGSYQEQNERLQAIENELLDAANRQARVKKAFEQGAYGVDDYTKRDQADTKN